MNREIKEMSVAVVYRDSIHPRIQIELSMIVAKLVIDNHEEITNNLKDDIAKAIDWALREDK